MSQLRIPKRLPRISGLRTCLIGIAMAATAPVLIGCRAASSTTPRADQVSGPAEPAVGSDGPFKRISMPVGISGYGDPIFSGNSRRFIALNQPAGNVRVWDVATLQPLCKPLPETGPAYGLTFDDKIAFTTDEHSVRFWNVETSKLICATKVTEGKLNEVAISFDGTQFLTIAQGEQAVEVWRTGEMHPRLIKKQDAVSAVFDPSGRRIAIHVAWDTHIFSSETGKEICPVISSRSVTPTDLTESFDATGRWFLMVALDEWRVVDTTTGKDRFHLNRPEPGSANDYPQIVRWSSDNSRIVAAAASHAARIYNAATGKLEWSVGTNVTDCWVGPDAHWAMGFRGPLQKYFDVWDVKTGRLVQSLKFDNGVVSPDCSAILTAREDGLDAVWRKQPN